MYLTIKETATYLSMKESTIHSFVVQGRIRAVHDGKQFMINKEQFTTHLKEVVKYKKQIRAYLNEPLPEDIDVKDED